MNFPVTFDPDAETFTYEEDGYVGKDGKTYCCVHHAWQAEEQATREERKRRDREELQDLWREETRRRKRERFFRKSWLKRERDAGTR